MAENSVRVICGSTAAGKSAIAIALALEYSATIVSADSRQIYMGFDIGTAKPEPSERRAVRHEGIDIVPPTERYSAARWADQAAHWIQASRDAGTVPLVVGGTGFYLRALFEPLFEAPALDPQRRTHLEKFLSAKSSIELRRWCEMLDPSRAHLGKTQLMRAIETVLLSGSRISDLHHRHASSSTEAQVTSASRPHPRYLLVDPGGGLSVRIEHRVDRMLDAGWADEVRALALTVDADAPAWNASGYKVLRGCVLGDMQLSEARERIIIETRQYAKRQRTWFRHQLGTASVTRVNPDDPDCHATVERWWKESS
ncbi:MAG: tRNA (adenosine(37)-N6)-dimethylallyltransferase MiaA [Gemmatimonadaceae bacterium]|nr:tRNA (adenosine(37)-N6)-dimethylallyltransferase MiaA [Gemmatimonadaceae bacterium]